MRPVAIIIMDGFGMSHNLHGNAIINARKPNFDRFWRDFPHATLESSGLAVGLPKGQMGNSEVGHLNLGAGRIVYQSYTLINLAVEEKKLAENRILARAMEEARNRKLHLIGLLSDGGVHSHISHLYALIELAKRENLNEVYVHAILDGRDVPPKSALKYVRELQSMMNEIGIGKVATVSGRYYAMDRDKRWDRIEKAYQCLTEGRGLRSRSAETAILDGYERSETDEFLQPTLVDSSGLIENGDSVIFFNFRPDRAREITHAFIDKDFQEFPRNRLEIAFTCMTQYDVTIDAPVAFTTQNLKDTLGEIVSKAGLGQLRIAETEKYAHVTYFFNGGKEEPNPKEDRILIPSPKVATYDMKPEMSAYEVARTAVEKIGGNQYQLIVVNFANPDMVGHTGVFDAALKAIEAVDACVGRVVDEILRQNGAVLLTADHGNAEKMIDETSHQAHTAHTTSKVPFILIMQDGKKHKIKDDGILADVAPTALQLLELPKPGTMTGKSLIITG
jgi:2,3-bisphosphoglycerate-independent phosphoglycerate mutase